MYYGFDMGGTKIEMAAFDGALCQVWKKRVETPKENYLELLSVFKELMEEADRDLGVEGTIGVGIPGVINRQSGEVFTTNIPAAKGKNFYADLQACLKRPIRMENDANCFALSEAWNEEFQNYPSLLGVILGTGIGGGLVINQQIFSGLNTITGEIGHLRLNVDALKILGKEIPLLLCGCGKLGCYENYLSGRGFEWLYHYFYQKPLTAPDIIARYRTGEADALEHVDRFSALLSGYLGEILTLFDPHLLVLGGGLSEFSELYEELNVRLPKELFSVARLPRIEKARYGNTSGVRGAAFLHLERLVSS